MTHKTYKIGVVVIFSILLLVSSCQQKESNKSISFYHWKSKAEYSNKIARTLTDSETNKIYMHYFDVDQVSAPKINDNGIYPNYVLKEIDTSYRDFEIIPVVYITNQVFKANNLDIEQLAARIKDLIHQISIKHFNKKINTIQIDCDWTQSTRYLYFNFLETIQKEFEVDVTIRLHQIKFSEKTGVPPVKHGTLMLYNMGDFKNNSENSILESKIVEQYITESTDYPLHLHLGLPLFSQTIICNTDNEYKILKNSNRTLYETDSHFKRIDENNFEVAIDTLYKGFYLTEGYRLKLEEVSQRKIIDSYQLVENSNLNIDEIIFYHLDDKTLNNINVNTLIKEL